MKALSIERMVTQVTQSLHTVTVYCNVLHFYHMGLNLKMQRKVRAPSDTIMEPVERTAL